MGLDRIVDFGKDLIDFERTNLREMGRKAKEDPERLFLGAADEFGSELWGKVLGKDYSPMVDRWGGPDASSWQRAEAEGVNLEPSQIMHGIAQSISQMYAAGYGKGKIKAFGQSQGWDPKAVDAGISAAERGIGAAQGGGEQQAEVVPHPPTFRPPQQRRAGVAGVGGPRPAFETTAPPAAQMPRDSATRVQPTFHAPVPAPIPAAPLRRRS